MNKFAFLLALALIGGVTLYYFSLPDQSTVVPVNESTSIDESEVINETPSIPEGALEYEIPGGSTVSYVALKKFFDKPEQYVTGTTDQVAGNGWFDFASGSGFISADLSMETIATDSKKRDEDVLVLFTDPNVRFIGNFTDLNLTSDEPFETEISGQVTINGITKQVPFRVSGVVSEDEIQVYGSTRVKMSDFDINPPSLVNVFTADDNLELKFDITANRIY